jgi:hypothetical protein
MPELDFEQARRDLLADIDVPELRRIRDRAQSIRRRRRNLVAVVAAVAVMAALGTGSLAIQRRTAPGPPAAATTSAPTTTLWHGGGLTLIGLTGPVLDLPGDLRDVEFADPRHGYALAAQCGTPGCRIALATTVDSGYSWHQVELPIVDTEADGVPSLITVDTGVVVRTASQAWFQRLGKPDWTTVDVTTMAPLDTIPDGSRLRLSNPIGHNGCADQPIEVWQPDGTVGRLRVAPSVHVCWVSPVRAADGRWWVGGNVDWGSTRLPAVAYSKNSGASWEVSKVAGPPGSWMQVSTLGSDTYAVVVSPRRGDPYPESLTVHLVCREVTGGFAPYASGVGTLIGDVVPRLDRGLVAAGPDWYVLARTGGAFQPAGGTMPWVYRLQRTPGGYVAYDLLHGGWAATSTDGETWQKINIR